MTQSVMSAPASDLAPPKVSLPRCPSIVLMAWRWNEPESGERPLREPTDASCVRLLRPCNLLSEILHAARSAERF